MTKTASRKARIRLGRMRGKRQFDSRESYLAAESSRQLQLLSIQQAYRAQRRRAVILFEGWDAAGKGGNIRRLTARLDPRGFKVWPIGAPGAEDQGRHYLYRFWARLPVPGSIAIFDRSWYGRVLVERVDKLAPRDAWMRAYDEINQFEAMLTADGVRVIKLFLHIGAKEQERRFRERLATPHKQWKLTAEDLRNRALRDKYRAAYEDMFEKTSTDAAPWSIVAGDHKWTARVAVQDIVIARLAHGVDIAPPPLDPDLRRAAERLLGPAGEVKRTG